MNGSDGFYSEAVGLSCYNYITQNTDRFARHSYLNPNLTKMILKIGQIIFMENFRFQEKIMNKEAVMEFGELLKILKTLK